jgi:hypothetical protein
LITGKVANFEYSVSTLAKLSLLFGDLITAISVLAEVRKTLSLFRGIPLVIGLCLLEGGGRDKGGGRVQ